MTKLLSMIILLLWCFPLSLLASGGDSLVQKEKLGKTVKRIERQESLLLNYELTRRNKRLTKALSRHATIDDLKLLTESTNSSVFCIAYLILAKMEDPASELIFDRYRTMTEAEMVNWDREINRINRKHRSDVVMLYTKGNFLEDVHDKKKFLDQIE
jgi:hypothetical protein